MAVTKSAIFENATTTDVKISLTVGKLLVRGGQKKYITGLSSADITSITNNAYLTLLTSWDVDGTDEASNAQDADNIQAYIASRDTQMNFFSADTQVGTVSIGVGSVETLRIKVQDTDSVVDPYTTVESTSASAAAGNITIAATACTFSKVVGNDGSIETYSEVVVTGASTGTTTINTKDSGSTGLTMATVTVTVA
jgi:hypothetical protein